MNTPTPRNTALIDFLNTIRGKTYGENLTIDTGRLLAWFEAAFNLERKLTAAREEIDRLLEQQEQWRLSSVCRELVEQRDKLAEALERILDYQGRFAEEEPESIAREALKSLAPNK